MMCIYIYIYTHICRLFILMIIIIINIAVHKHMQITQILANTYKSLTYVQKHIQII